MGIYLENGYLNAPWIRDLANKHNISFVVIIGARQIGKTYNVTKMALDDGKPFIFMRRTGNEAKFISNDVNNPFTKYKDYSISVEKDSDYTYSIKKEVENSDPQYIGMLVALSSIAKIRGFNGDLYTDVIYDECIPENHVHRIKDEEDAFLNAYTTIAGAREEMGGKPLRVWLLANSNRIDAPILRALDISEKVEHMKNSGQEFAMLKERGIIILMPKSEDILSKRKRGALARAISKESKFSKMAYNNEFSYNDDSDIFTVKNIKLYRLRMIVDGVGIYTEKANPNHFYCTPFITGTVETAKHFHDTEKDRAYIRRHYPILREAYACKLMLFSDLTCKAKILDMLYN